MHIPCTALLSMRFLVLLLFVLMGTACSKGNDKRTPLIGFSLAKDSPELERWQRDHDYFIEEVERYGGEVISKIAHADDQQQLAQVREMITAGIQVLVVMPHDSKAAASIVELAHKSGVKVIAYDRLILDCDLDYYISFNNVRVGELQAGHITRLLPRGNYVLLGGAPTDFNAQEYREGQFNVLNPFIARGEIKIVDDRYIDEWQPSEAYLATIDVLSRNHNKIDAIVAANDALAGGVIKALEEKGMSAQVMVSGQDAELTACHRLLNGSQSMTVYKSVRQLATRAAQLALHVARREPTREINHSVYNGAHIVPSVLLLPVAVEKENLDATVIMDGYHSKEEIYGIRNETL